MPMSAPGRSTSGEALTTAHAFDIRAAQERLRERGAFVGAGAEHRFVGYEQLSVLVSFEQGSG
jgi:hypothetical protein